MRTTLIMIASLLLAACGLGADSGKVYPMAGKDARQALLHIEPPLELLGSTISSAHAVSGGDGTIRWALADRSAVSVINLVATTKDEGPQEVRIIVSLEPSKGSHHDDVAARLEQNPAVVNYFKAVMAEQIDSTLNHREFDMAAIQGQMAVAAMSLAPQMAESFDKAAKQSEDSDRSNIENAYAHEGEDDRSYEPDDTEFGKPMDAATGSDVN
jgi:hypothetical protein